MSNYLLIFEKTYLCKAREAISLFSLVSGRQPSHNSETIDVAFPQYHLLISKRSFISFKDFRSLNFL